MSRVAIVTGGGRGIGRAVTIALSRNGWNVVVAGRTASSLTDTVAEIGNGLAVATDVSVAEDVERLFTKAVESFGRVDLLFNNAGIGAPAVPIDDLDVATWRQVVDVNLTGSFLCARAAFAQMRDQSPSGGRIINNGSISASTPRPFSVAYTATKHAITGLTKSLALDGRELGITCGQIDIGNASSEMANRVADGALQPDGSRRREPVMDVENVANAVLYMANLPPDANVLSMTVMANGMPFVGRG